MDAPKLLMVVKAKTRTFFLVRMVVTALAGTGAWLLTWAVPFPANMMIAAGVWLYVFYGWWSMHPRPCVFCKDRSTRAMLFKSWDPPWWDLRYPRRRDVLWACPEHYPFVIMLRVAHDAMAHDVMAAEQARREHC